MKPKQSINDVATHKRRHSETWYLFELLDELGSFNPTLHIKADVHFDLCEGVGQFDDGNLGTRDTSANTEHTGTTAKLLPRDSDRSYRSTIITTIPDVGNPLLKSSKI